MDDPTNSPTVFGPRGDSPPPEAIPGNLCPIRYSHNPQEFEELISRGITLAFCETWHATFNEEDGIIVQADDCLRKIYCDPMGECESWSIWIGRRIKLYDDDPEGGGFMEHLLDLIFEDMDDLWITYKEPEGSTHWVTRPVEGMENTVVDVVDEYEVESGEEDDREPSIGYAGDTSESEAESTTHPASSECESTWWPDDSENETEAEEGGA